MSRVRILPGALVDWMIMNKVIINVPNTIFDGLGQEWEVTVAASNVTIKNVVPPTDETRWGYLEECPECGKMSVRAKELWEGGGVVCITPKCGYWFCY